jgi:hypothetical protein
MMLTIVGVVGIAWVTFLGFEEPHTPVLLLATAMMLIAPIGALAHLGLTRKLTDNEKRIWLTEFASSEMWSALSEYLSSDNLSDSAKRRADAAIVRRRKSATRV